VLQIVQSVEKRLQLLDRLPKVRIKAWLTKLRETVSSEMFVLSTPGNVMVLEQW
jgi:hypothetical protein